MRELANGVFIEDVGKKSLFLTKNLVVGESVYGERIWQKEYRVIEPMQSKLGALLAKTNGKVVLDVKKGSFVLYLGASTGTTVSHFSDIVGNEGGVFAVELSPRVMRDLVFLCDKRKNIAPILESANHPEEYADKVMKVDFLYQDV
ncbi:MAG: fibrillarin-like rRNA/tRNA 2'-O-methyltransferase, partial [Nanoarchaeota archaeon]